MRARPVLRLRIARSLRKWADLLDPHVRPSETMTLRIEVDASEAETTIARMAASVRELNFAECICVLAPGVTLNGETCPMHAPR